MLADFQPVSDGGRYAGCVLRAPDADSAGFEGPWEAYVYVGGEPIGVSDAHRPGKPSEDATYVSCGVFAWLSEAMGAVERARHEFTDAPGILDSLSEQGKLSSLTVVTSRTQDVIPKVVLGRSGCGGRVEPSDASQIVLGTVFAGNRPVLSDADGAACRLRDYAECPQCEDVGGSSHCDRAGQRRVVVVRDLHDHHDVALKDGVAGFLVEACRGLVGGDGADQCSLVVCRPAVAEHLELESDAFSPVLGADCDPLDQGYVAADHLCGIVSLEPREVLGCYFVWADERSCYEVVLGPRPYKRRPERAVVLSDAVWERSVGAVRDLFGQEPFDCLCLDLVRRRPDVDPGFGSVGGHEGEQPAHTRDRGRKGGGAMG